jgi:predicted nucleic acid-binding protein
MDDFGSQGDFLSHVRSASHKPYLDSSVFFAHIKKESVATSDGRQRWELTERIFADAEAGKYKIHTSTATLAEVRRIKNKSDELTSNELTIVRRFFEHEYILLIEVSREIGEKAQLYGAQFGIDVIDSIHLATAIDEQCDVLFVWDKPFTKIVPSSVENVTVCEPYWEGIIQMGQQQDNSDG